MKEHKKEKTNVMRLLDAAGIPYRTVGMKTRFPTYRDETAVLFEEIAVSAGMRGAQVILNPEKLGEYVGAEFCDLTLS